MNQHSVIQETSGINSFYSKVYSFVGLGVAISALVSALMLTVFQQVIIAILLQYTWLYYVAIFAELGLVWAASSMSMKNSPAALPVFLTYSALNGFTISLILAGYTQSAVYTAFAVSAGMFFVMAVIGRVTKKDLSGMGRAMIAALVGLIIASLVNIFMRNSALDYIISIISVLVFSGLIAYDNQRIRYVYEQTNGTAGIGWVVSLALSLYLDFVNLFLSILRIFGRND